MLLRAIQRIVVFPSRGPPSRLVEKIAAFPAERTHAEREQRAADDAARVRIETDARIGVRRRLNTSQPSDRTAAATAR